jgi:hypothetical protein
MDAGGARRPNPRGGDIRPWEPPIDPDVFRQDCTMRRIKIIERPGETYSYAAVDRQNLNEGQVVEYEEVSNRGKTSAENLKVQR